MTETKQKTTVDYILETSEEFIKVNQAKYPKLTEARFGWLVLKDSNLLPRLRRGGDITTRKLDAFVKFIKNPNSIGELHDEEK